MAPQETSSNPRYRLGSSPGVVLRGLVRLLAEKRFHIRCTPARQHRSRSRPKSADTALSPDSRPRSAATESQLSFVL